MKQELKSERSRRQILDSALDLFSHRGYGATSIRDIAQGATVSTGNVYHHFTDKEDIYNALFDEYWAAISSPDFPFNQALASGVFPDNLEALGWAAEQSVRQYKKQIALIYVDVVEFDGSHIRRFYADMAQRFSIFIDAHGRAEVERRLRPGVSPVAAVMLATRFFLNFFSVEILFGVKDHFGKATDQTIREISDILRRGMLRDEELAKRTRTVKAAKKK
ncbi:MAG: TetR/AcrR family transcriptional regulator [Acidobacteria bacterium]|nr:TetR/AcrR family transcriptional regulator [Acidobacteriota bacterium]